MSFFVVVGFFYLGFLTFKLIKANEHVDRGAEFLHRWILLVLISVFEEWVDVFFFWLPFYHLLKMACLFAVIVHNGASWVFYAFDAPIRRFESGLETRLAAWSALLLTYSFPLLQRVLRMSVQLCMPRLSDAELTALRDELGANAAAVDSEQLRRQVETAPVESPHTVEMVEQIVASMEHATPVESAALSHTVARASSVRMSLPPSFKFDLMQKVNRLKSVLTPRKPADADDNETGAHSGEETREDKDKDGWQSVHPSVPAELFTGSLLDIRVDSDALPLPHRLWIAADDLALHWQPHDGGVRRSGAVTSVKHAKPLELLFEVRVMTSTGDMETLLVSAKHTQDYVTWTDGLAEIVQLRRNSAPNSARDTTSVLSVDRSTVKDKYSSYGTDVPRRVSSRRRKPVERT